MWGPLTIYLAGIADSRREFARYPVRVRKYVCNSEAGTIKCKYKEFLEEVDASLP